MRSLTLLLFWRKFWDATPLSRYLNVRRLKNLISEASPPSFTSVKTWGLLNNCPSETQVSVHVIRTWAISQSRALIHTVCRIFPSYLRYTITSKVKTVGVYLSSEVTYLLTNNHLRLCSVTQNPTDTVIFGKLRALRTICSLSSVTLLLGSTITAYN